jgi:hypothetical protein
MQHHAQTQAIGLIILASLLLFQVSGTDAPDANLEEVELSLLDSTPDPTTVFEEDVGTGCCSHSRLPIDETPAFLPTLKAL